MQKKYFILRKNVLYLTFCKLCQKKVVSLYCETKTKFSHVYYSFLKHVRKCKKSRNFIMVKDYRFNRYVNALKRLELFADVHSLSLRKFRISKAYSLLLYAFENHLRVIRPCLGRFDYTLIVCFILDEIGVYYLLSNDAPRGGKRGNYIQIYLHE